MCVNLFTIFKLTTLFAYISCIHMFWIVNLLTNLNFVKWDRATLAWILLNRIKNIYYLKVNITTIWFCDCSSNELKIEAISKIMKNPIFTWWHIGKALYLQGKNPNELCLKCNKIDFRSLNVNCCIVSKIQTMKQKKK